MPMYTLSSKTQVEESLCLELSRAITDIHCGITGAPRTFVQVVFSHGVPLRAGAHLNVLGNVRKGRTGEMNDLLKQDLREGIAAIMNAPVTTIDLSLFEVPAGWVMEGGEVLPEPGEEEHCEWLKEEHPSDSRELTG